MVDIQSPTAEIRRVIVKRRRKKEEERNHRAKKIMSANVRGHNNYKKKTLLNLN